MNRGVIDASDPEPPESEAPKVTLSSPWCFLVNNNIRCMPSHGIGHRAKYPLYYTRLVVGVDSFGLASFLSKRGVWLK